jgi:hypothetical protein
MWMVGVILGNGRCFAPRTHVPTPTRTFAYPKLLVQMPARYSANVTESGKPGTGTRELGSGSYTFSGLRVP